MRVLITNWINLVGVFIAVLAYATAANVFGASGPGNFGLAMLGSLVLICLYGWMLWLLFTLLLAVLDLIFIVRAKSNITGWLIIEWLIVSAPFIYWTVKYGEPVFIAASVGLLAAQMIRKKYLRRYLDFGRQ